MEERQLSGFTDISGENIKTKVLVCKFALVVRDAGIPEQLVEEADILTEVIGMEGEGIRYHKI